MAPLRLRRHDPTTLPALQRTYRAYDRVLQHRARRYGLERPAVLTSNPFLARDCPLQWAGPVTFYATDDWPSAYDHRGWRDGFVDAFRVIGRSGIAVCAVSSAIIDRIEPTGPSMVVPNGLQPAEWDRLPPPPDWFKALPAPRMLYVGTLDSRLDAEMLRAAAEANDGGSIALVGPTFDREHVTPLEQIRGVTVHDRVGRQDLAGLLGVTDIALIPTSGCPSRRP